MAKTCGACEKGTVSGFFTDNEDIVKKWVRCSVTGKEHVDGYPCDVPDKPRLCEVLGVDVGEQFRVRTKEQAEPIGPIWVSGFGGLMQRSDLDPVDVLSALIEAINHPAKIERLPRLADKEREICRLLGAKWVSRNPGNDRTVDLWTVKPRTDLYGAFLGNPEAIATIYGNRFSSIAPGHAVQVEDAT